jgi:hypothetical protein
LSIETIETTVRFLTRTGIKKISPFVYEVTVVVGIRPAVMSTACLLIAHMSNMEPEWKKPPSEVLFFRIITSAQYRELSLYCQALHL